MTRTLAARRTLAAAALAPLLTAGLVACGSDDGSASKADDTSSVAPASSELEPGDEVDPDEFVKTVTDGLEASTTAHLTLTVSAGSTGTMKAEGDVDYTSSPPSMAMTMTLPSAAGGDMDVRMVDGLMYMSLGQMTQGKFWKIDPSDPNGPMGALGMDKLMDQMDPAKALQAMGDGISEVEYAGDEDDLHHYTLTVDMKKMLSSMGSGLPQQAQGQLPDSVTYDLWLDDEKRFSKMEMDDLPTGAETGSMEMTVSDWGKDVDIEAPPSSQVTEMPDFGSMASPSA